jgi:zinc finger CCCH domain-containing protein 13
MTGGEHFRNRTPEGCSMRKVRCPLTKNQIVDSGEESEKVREQETETERDRETERQRQRETERQRDRERQRETERDRER